MTATRYIERRPECEAMLITADNLAEVAAWCGGLADVDCVLYRVNGVRLEAKIGTYLVHEGDLWTDHSVEDFERRWQPAAQAGNA